MRLMQEQATNTAAEGTALSRTPLAFLSYVNLDDQHEQGRLTQFRERLSGEVRIQTGEPFDIFQDRKDIAWGQQWQERLDSSLAAVTFLLPIITPAFFKSNACRAELERFLKREKELGRSDLILPVYYLTCPVLADKEKLQHDQLAQIVAARQYADWRHLRFKPFDSEQVCETLAKMAQQIVAALERSHIESSRAAAARPASKQPEKESKGAASQSNTFQSGGGPQSAALGKGAIGTQNNYYGPPVLPPEKPKPKTHVCRAIVAGLLLSAALLWGLLYYIDEFVELTKQYAADVASVKIELATVVVDQQGKGDYATITEALKAVKAGGKIFVRPGVYKEGIVIDKQVEIIGDGKRDEIVIEASGQDAVVFQANSGRIANLTLRQTDGEWFAVNITKGRAALEDCDISSQSLASVAIHDSAEPTLHRNRIHDGKSSGVVVYDNGQGTLEDNEIFANAYAGVAIMTGGKPTLRRNRIFKNSYWGIWVHDKGGGIFEDNDLRGNAKGAWYIDSDSTALVQRSGNIE